MSDIDRKGIKFLNYLYKDMYKSEEVMHGVDERFIGNKVIILHIILIECRICIKKFYQVKEIMI